MHFLKLYYSNAMGKEINKNVEAIYQFIEKYNFITLISYDDKDLLISHIPVILNRKQGQYGTLIGHLAKVNPHIKMLDTNKESLGIFHGPHAYISPTWYKTSPNVPTWNYAVIHVYGILKQVSTKRLSNDLFQMLKYHEPLLTKDNSDILLNEYPEKLITHIVGFKLEISKIETRFKLGQNRSPEDRESMLAALRNKNIQESTALADLMEAVFEG